MSKIVILGAAYFASASYGLREDNVISMTTFPIVPDDNTYKHRHGRDLNWTF